MPRQVCAEGGAAGAPTLMPAAKRGVVSNQFLNNKNPLEVSLFYHYVPVILNNVLTSKLFYWFKTSAIVSVTVDF